MFPWLRLFGVGLSLIGKSKVDLLATTRVRLRVWPNDLDYNLHVNNARYLALSQISGVYWFVRTGSLGIARQHKAFPVIGDALAKFRHDLKVFQNLRDSYARGRLGQQVGVFRTPLRAQGSRHWGGCRPCGVKGSEWPD